MLDYLTQGRRAARRFAPGESRALAPFFNLVLVFNKGAAFSFLASAQGWQTLLFAAIAVVASVVISFSDLQKSGQEAVLRRPGAHPGRRARQPLRPRWCYGHVVDFLDFHAAGWHWPAFNVADSAITVGAAILIVESFLHRETDKHEKQA